MDYTVLFTWDEEAEVWVATSSDIIGLVLESESLDVLMNRVKEAVPELLELNDQKPANTISYVCDHMEKTNNCGKTLEVIKNADKGIDLSEPFDNVDELMRALKD